MTYVLGLTGSIGMGKSATATMFRELGVPVHDADATVHALYRGRAAPVIDAAFPGTLVDGAVDRTKLGAAVIGQPERMRRLESIVHPMVREEEEAFLQAASQARAPSAVLDVPPHYETGDEARCDAVVVVSEPSGIQHERVLARPGMSADKFAALSAKQMPDAEKRARADFIVDTGSGFANARAQVARIVQDVSSRPGRVLPDPLSREGREP